MALTFQLSYDGNDSDQHQIGFYDVSQALWGFERVLSITTNLIINGNVITQSPSAKGFQLLALPSEEGSWVWQTVLAVGATVGAFGVASPNSMFGWLARSAVDYVIKETLGFEPNFDETLGKQIEEYREKAGRLSLPIDLDEGRFDSVIEKCETGVRAIHRPIVFSKTAKSAKLSWSAKGKSSKLGESFNPKTYEYMSKTITSEDFSEYCGVVSSYNTNTFIGRLFFPEEKRTIPFELAKTVRNLESIRLIVTSLRENAIKRNSRGRNRIEPNICMTGIRNESTSGRLKKLFVTEVNATPIHFTS